MDELFRDYRQKIRGPVYPPYHQGFYFEEYFYRNYNQNLAGERIYLPIFWTAAYLNKQRGLNKVLCLLDKDKKYFAVSQHDDAIIEELPIDTLHFNAGGNKIRNQNIPIPLICSPILSQNKGESRSIKASFVGSLTHPLREALKDIKEENYYIKIGEWDQNVKQELWLEYESISLKSQFMLCPRGYGPTSFRLYESFQFGCVPVIITDNLYLPFEDEINWKEIAVIVTSDDISNIVDILNGIDNFEYELMRSRGRHIYDNYFTYDKAVYHIIKRLH